MKISFKNLDPIKQVEMDLSKKINLIVGENGVGKTYLTNAVYGLQKTHFQEVIEPKNTINKIFRNLNQKGDKYTISITNILEIQKEYTKLDNSFISHVFAYKEAQKIFDKAEIKIEGFKYLLKNIEIKFQLAEILVQKEKDSLDINFILSENKDPDNNRFLRYVVFRKIFDKLPESFILPAERGAVDIFNKELSIKRNETFDRVLELANKDDDNEDNSLSRLLSKNKRYTLPVRDSLGYADDLYQISQSDGELAYIADMIEQDVLNGALSVSRDGKVFFAHNKIKTKKMPLDITASTVKSIAKLVFFLRHTSSKGMTLFIDEPELNLHPNNQILLARILVRIANAGIKLFISTHSDYIMREFNNMIVANNVQDTDYYSKEIYLNPDDIDVTRLFFKNSNNRLATAEKVKIETDGFTVDSIDNSIIDQNSINDDLVSKIGEDDEPK